MKKRILCILLSVACILVELVFAPTIGWNAMSNVYENQTAVVTLGQPLTVSPGGGGGSGGLPKAMIVAVPADLPIDVVNPNAGSVTGLLMLNFTASGITANDVTVFCAPCYDSNVIEMGVYGNTLVFEMQTTGMLLSPYYTFRPGLNSNVTVATIQYNTPGNYTYDLAVIQ